MTPALILALSLMLTDAPPADSGGEPLPPGAPTDSYELSAWCYGALEEYLAIYERVKPDLRDIDNMFGSPVVEDEPYQSDMAAARDELKMIGEAVTDAEQASARPIAEQGAAAMRQGQAIWSVAEARPQRELARAWLSWALPDRCDSNARELARRSVLLGKALNYNADTPPATPPAGTPPAAPPANANAAPPSLDSIIDQTNQPPAPADTPKP
jgi:hypothetical protein